MAKSVSPSPCPSCTRPVTVTPSCGGRGTGNLTSYEVVCPCGYTKRQLGYDGKKMSAIREWNRAVKALERSDPMISPWGRRHAPIPKTLLKSLRPPE